MTTEKDSVASSVGGGSERQHSASLLSGDAKNPRIVAAVEYIKNYMATYDKQFGYADYSEQTYIDDVLYGLGASLGDQYKWASGFAAFKRRLLERLTAEPAMTTASRENGTAEPSLEKP